MQVSNFQIIRNKQTKIQKQNYFIKTSKHSTKTNTKTKDLPKPCSPKLGVLILWVILVINRVSLLDTKLMPQVSVLSPETYLKEAEHQPLVIKPMAPGPTYISKILSLQPYCCLDILYSLLSTQNTTNIHLHNNCTKSGQTQRDR